MANGSNTTEGGNVAGPAETETPAPKGTGVRGRVSDPSGAAIEGAAITVSPNPEGAGPVSQELNVTDTQGRYFYPLPPGHWEVTVAAYGYRPVTDTVVVEAGDPAIHKLVLKPN